MNFSPFGGHFPASIPSIHQFAAKFHDGSGALVSAQDSANRYHNTGVNMAAHFNQHHAPLGVPVNMGKFARQPENVAVSNNSNVAGSQHNMMNTGSAKYHTSGSNLPHQYPTGSNLSVPYTTQSSNIPQPTQVAQGRVSDDKQRQVNVYQQQPQGGQELPQDLCAIMQSQGQQSQVQESKERRNDKSVKQERDQQEDRPGSNETDYNVMHQQSLHHHNQSATMPATWQSLATPGSTVADYLSHLPASTLPLSLHHFLKYSAESIKKENLNTQQDMSVGNQNINLNLGNANMNLVATQVGNTVGSGLSPPAKKKKKKKAAKEKKPRPKPGEIRLTTALDGSTLYCCPECQMAYPEKELLEQHLVGHTLERRFVCDICNAALKRKDHLTRHKQSHNPERPYVCTVCLKAFKRKEQLTLHFVIHSGEKRHICPECGKGFYRKDHLRKHTRSHIARRVKAELSQQAGPATPSVGVSGGVHAATLQAGQVSAPGPPQAPPSLLS